MIDPEAFESTEEQFASSVSSDAPDDAHPPRTHLRHPVQRESGERAAEASSVQRHSVWKQEVADRVEGYRNRRSKKRLSGEFSMNLDFGSPVYPAYAAPQRSSALPEEEPADFFEDEPEPIQSAEGLSDGMEAEPAVETEVEPLPPAAPPERAGREMKVNIIEFPRPPIFPEFDDPNALAEPVLQTPRILDVPEEVPTEPPPFNEIELGILPDEEEPAPPAFELPLQVAPIPQRFTAAVLDALIVLCTTGLFGLIALHFLSPLPYSKPALVMAVAVPVVLWAAYQYLFLVHAGTTLGMQMSGVRLSTFEGTPVPRRSRQVRALVLVLSAVSLGLGFLWALFDEDALCWHDKVTRTYLTM